MSTAILASASNSSTESDFAQSSTRTTISGRKGPIVWGERSFDRTQDVVRPGQRARITNRRPGAVVAIGPRSDRSRPGRSAVSYGRPSLTVSKAASPLRRDISMGTNLTRMMVVWTLGLGIFFGVLGGLVFDDGKQSPTDATFAPTYASYSAQ